MINKNNVGDKDGIRTTVYIPKVLHSQLRLVAFENNVSASEIVREAVKHYIARKAKRAVKVKAATSISQ